MPTWVAIGFLVFIGIMIFVFTVVGLQSAIKTFVPRIRGHWTIQSPIVRKRTNPLQWLVDIAAEEREHAASRIYITDRTIQVGHLTDASPYVTFLISVTNGCIYPVFWEGVTGKVYFLNNPLEKDIEEPQRGGRSRWLRGFRGHIRLRQFLPSDAVEQLKLDLADNPTIVRAFSLSSVTLSFTADTPEGTTTTVTLGGNRNFVVTDE